MCKQFCNGVLMALLAPLGNFGLMSVSGLGFGGP